MNSFCKSTNLKRLISILVIIAFFSIPANVFADKKADLQSAKEAYERGDNRTAFDGFKILAENGNAEAQYYLGMLFIYGEKEIHFDKKKSLKWIKLSAKNGFAKAQLELGDTYFFGWGVPKNDLESLKWHRMAAEQGSKVAQSELGWMYENAKGGAEDLVRAHMWYNIAVTNGDLSAASDRNKVEMTMTPKQVVEAQKLAREWMEKHGKK